MIFGKLLRSLFGSKSSAQSAEGSAAEDTSLEDISFPQISGTGTIPDPPEEEPAEDLAEPEVPAEPAGDLTEPEVPAEPVEDLTEPEVPAAPAGDLTEPEVPAEPARDLTEPEVPAAPVEDLTEPEVPDEPVEDMNELTSEADPETPAAADDTIPDIFTRPSMPALDELEALLRGEDEAKSIPEAKADSDPETADEITSEIVEASTDSAEEDDDEASEAESEITEEAATEEVAAEMIVETNVEETAEMMVETDVEETAEMMDEAVEGELNEMKPEIAEETLEAMPEIAEDAPTEALEAAEAPEAAEEAPAEASDASEEDAPVIKKAKKDKGKSKDKDKKKKKKQQEDISAAAPVDPEDAPRPIYENRELSWLKFNGRVLEEAQKSNVPLCERLTFLSIYQTNLDEFFMVRVGSLEDQKLLPGDNRENKTNMTPEEQIKAITRQVNRLNTIKDDTYRNCMDQVEQQGVRIISFQQMSRDEEKTLGKYFMNNIVPFLSVMIVGRKQPFPFMKSQDIYAMAILPDKDGKEKIGLIPCSGGVFPRLIAVPGTVNTFVLSEELILHFLPKVYPGYRIKEKSLIRITRNADIDVNKVYDEDLNYRDQMAELVKLRKKLAPIRLELTRDISPKTVEKLCRYCGLKPSQAFQSQAPLDMSFLFQIEDILRRDPKNVYPKRVPQNSPALDRTQPILPQVLDHDVLLHYPYETIDPFLRMLQEAANDPQVISMRMTLYRLARNSKVVEALADAAENGKQVDVLVELKARFDEANNIEWSRRLEDAGCHVIYGIDGLKVHSKLCQITRRGEDGMIQYITQIGTGNYNEKTSRLYTDLSLMTANSDIAMDAAEVFHSILLGETVDHMNCLLVAPKCLQAPVLEMIDQEINHAKAGEPAYIGLKLNSLTDKRIMDKLAEASRAGVKIEMVIRGINCLKSGVPGETENITVKSIVGRFLEHSRIYIFGTPDRDKIYISSADFMTRNTLRRVEVATPIFNEDLKERVRGILNTLMHDNIQGRIQKSDGNYRTDANEEEPLNAQEHFFDEAYAAAGTTPEQ